MIQTFHYALRPGGYLCLGPSEGVTRDANLFAAARQEAPDSPAPRHIRRRRSRFAEPFGMRTCPARRRRAPPFEDRIDMSVRRVMSRISPAYLVIDSNHEILRFSGAEAGHYLEPSAGTASLNLFGIVRRSAAGGACRPAEALADGAGLVRRIPTQARGLRRSVTLIIEPISRPAWFVVAFRGCHPFINADGAASDAAGGTSMEQELRATKAQLRATIDRVGDLHRGNQVRERGVSIGQRGTAILQRGTRNLQGGDAVGQRGASDVNAEMSSKNEVLTRLNSDLKNLLDSTQIATIFLDRELRIRSFTPD